MDDEESLGLLRGGEGADIEKDDGEFGDEDERAVYDLRVVG